MLFIDQHYFLLTVHVVYKSVETMSEIKIDITLL